MKKIPIGRDFLKDIIEGDFYYVDKTKMIEELLDKGAYVTLFQRPRRFGKSLMISTIDEFFNIEKAESNKNLFDGLYIAKSQYKDEQGKYPVIYLNFKSMKSDNWEHMYAIIREEFREVFANKRYLMDVLDDDEKKVYTKILYKEANQDEYEKAIKMLSQAMEKYYGKKAILLIDEYDVPIQNGYLYGYYDEIVLFIKNLFGNGLKTNNSIKFAVMTGILRVSKESIFSDINNVKVYSVEKDIYDEYFGFTEQETKDLLEHYGLQLTEEVKKMYDGYKFGNKEIYNPWSILNYAEEKTLMPYWVNTSSDELLKDLFDRSKERTSEMLEKLILGEEVKIQYNDKITFLDLKAVQSEDAINVIGNFLLFSGYLTIENKEHIEDEGIIDVRIPNAEVKRVYTDIISKWTTSKIQMPNIALFELSRYILNEDKAKIEKTLNEALKSMSFYDEYENFYHGYMLGLFVSFMNKEYIVKSNREAGEGRFDIMIEKIDRSVGIIVEFKVAKENEDIEKVAIEGKEQIKNKKYYEEIELDKVQKILTYCVAFKGKECKVV